MTTVINLSSLDGSNGFRLDGEAANDFSGVSVSNAGDINGDGFDDVIIGTFGDDSNGGRASAISYVVFGKATGFNAAINLSSLDGNNGFRMDAESTYDRLDISFGNAGDVNGDGFDDSIVYTSGIDFYGYGYKSSPPVMWCLARHPVLQLLWIYPVLTATTVFAWMGSQAMIDRLVLSRTQETSMAMVWGI